MILLIRVFLILCIQRIVFDFKLTRERDLKVTEKGTTKWGLLTFLHSPNNLLVLTI